MFRISQFIRELDHPVASGPRRNPPGPVVIWNLIRRCNLTCEHCYSISADKDFPCELNTQEVFKVMDDVLKGLDALASAEANWGDIVPALYNLALRAWQVLEAFVKYAKAFFLLHGEAAERLLEEAKTFQEAVSEILKALGDCIEGLQALSQVETPFRVAQEVLNSLVSSAYQVLEAFVKYASAFHRLHHEAAETLFAQVRAFVEALESVLGVVEEALETLDLLTATEGGWSDLTEKVDLLVARLFEIFRGFVQLYQAFQLRLGPALEEVLQGLDPFLNAVKSVVETLQSAVEGIPALAAVTLPSDWGDLPQRLADLTLQLVQAFAEAASRLESEGMEMAAAFGEAAGKVLESVGKAVEGVGGLLGYSGGLLRGTVEQFAADLALVVEALSTVAASFPEEALASTTDFAEAAGKVGSSLKSSVEGLAALVGYSGLTCVQVVEDFARSILD